MIVTIMPEVSFIHYDCFSIAPVQLSGHICFSVKKVDIYAYTQCILAVFVYMSWALFSPPSSGQGTWPAAPFRFSCYFSSDSDKISLIGC
jgi:hypothetical protein